jgi:hypothetical protein
VKQGRNRLRTSTRSLVTRPPRRRARLAHLPRGDLLSECDVLQRQLPLRANRGPPCPNEDRKPSHHIRSIADQSRQPQDNRAGRVFGTDTRQALRQRRSLRALKFFAELLDLLGRQRGAFEEISLSVELTLSTDRYSNGLVNTRPSRAGRGSITVLATASKRTVRPKRFIPVSYWGHAPLEARLQRRHQEICQRHLESSHYRSSDTAESLGRR